MEGPPVIDSINAQLLSYGGVGILAVLLLTAVVALWFELKREREARIEALEASIALTKEMRETLETVISAVRGRRS